jgi:hypothetical protein
MFVFNASVLLTGNIAVTMIICDAIFTNPPNRCKCRLNVVLSFNTT